MAATTRIHRYFWRRDMQTYTFTWCDTVSMFSGCIKGAAWPFGVYLKVEQKVLVGKNLSRLRAYHSRAFQSFLFSTFSSWFYCYEEDDFVVILTLTMIMLLWINL